MGGAGTRATSVIFVPQIQAGYGKSLSAKTRCQVLECSDVLVHDFLSAQVAPIHCVLLEGPHKVFKHSLDPEFSQEVVSGNVFGERSWNAV